MGINALSPSGKPSGEAAGHALAPPDLPVQPFDHVARADSPAVPVRELIQQLGPRILSRRQFAVAFSLLASISAVTVSALFNADSRDSMANTAFRAADAHSRWLGGTLESTLRKKCTMHRWHLAFGSIESTVATSPAHRSPTTSRTPFRPRSITADANGVCDRIKVFTVGTCFCTP